MSRRILLTGIPSHYTRLIQGASGSSVFYSERQPRPEAKDDFLRELRNISNTGNYLIGEGAFQALSPRTVHIPFWHLYNSCTNGAGLDEINEKFDICVFTCANLLRKGLSADAEALVLSNLRMPVVALGIGIQRRADLASSLPSGTQKFLSVLKEREHYFLTRGEATASFLKDSGFSFVRPVGCPSTYFLSDNVRSALSRLRDVRVGRAKTVFSGYLGAELDSIADVNALTPADGTSSYILQDEFLHFDMQIEPDENGRIYNAASGQLIGRLTFKDADRLKRRLKLHAFFDTNQWRAWTSTMEFSFGRRFHGSIIALQAGVPSLMVAVDDRMREMLDFVGLPYVDATKLGQANKSRAEFVADHLAGINVSEVVERYREREKGFRSALKEIGIG
jgi:hypothetical protein